MAAWLLWASIALAGVTADGSSGGISNPTFETVPRGAMSAAMGLTLGQTGDLFVVQGFPLGLGVGISGRSEMGFRLRPAAWKPLAHQSDLPTGFGLTFRTRLMEPTGRRVGLAFQVTADGTSWFEGVEALGIGRLARRRVTVDVAFGPRWEGSAGFQAWTGASLEYIVSPNAHLLSELSLGVGQQGVHEWSYRSGVRTRQVGNVEAVAWAGGGAFQGQPWVGAGVFLAYHTYNPKDADFDDDQVPNDTDRCRYDSEDRDGWEDDDGCPEWDNDQDGIPDAEDPTPDGEEVVPVQERRRYEGPTPRLKMRIRGRPPAGSSDPALRPERSEADDS